MKITDPKERINICRKCERFNPLLVQCKECGCLLAFKTKMKKQDCPLNKWEVPEEENASISDEKQRDR